MRYFSFCLLFVFCLPHFLLGDDVIPAKPKARWYKGNLHTHSLWSDGNDFPEVIAEWYRTNGYNFLAMSDHNVLSRGAKWINDTVPADRGAIGGVARYLERFGDQWVEVREHDGQRQIRLKPISEYRALVEQRGEFILIQAEEITDSAEGLPVHINASNLRDVINPQGGDTVRDTIRNNLNAVKSQSVQAGRPILAHLNHPNFGYGVTAEDLADVVEERFFEVYNGHPSVGHRGDENHASTERLWDIANTIRLGEMQAVPLYGVATDDSHNYFGLRGASPGRGWVMVRATHLTPESIVKAIDRGDFYASSGVVLNSIHYDSAKKTYSIEIDAQPGETYTTEFIGTVIDYDATSRPVLDADQQPIRATRRYSGDVGKTLAVVKGDSATYRLTGDELYVRATITSSAKAENPFESGQRQQAWAQPVGWRKHVK
ncbi:MAG: hypothetical protein P8N76_20975 [Pirellulaceae bacterium]|nr:hypothetical protein [Pirellulaceae bacterium]